MVVHHHLLQGAKLQDSCFISGSAWRDANDAGTEPSLVLICSLQALQAPSAFQGGRLFQGWEESGRRKEAVQSGSASYCSRLVVRDGSGAYWYYLFETVITYTLDIGQTYGARCERKPKDALGEGVQWESVPTGGYVGLLGVGSGQSREWHTTLPSRLGQLGIPF